MAFGEPTGNSSERRRWLVAAFADESHARQAAGDAQHRGTDAREIRIGNSLDALASIQAEMHEELERAGTGVTGPIPKEGVRTIVVGAAVGAVIGIVIALPFAAIDFGLTTSTRMLILGAVGLVFGAFLGAYLGGMFGSKRPSEPVAAADGCMLALPDTELARQALLDAQPTRVDVFGAGGFLIGTLATDDPGVSGTAGQVADHAHDERRPD